MRMDGSNDSVKKQEHDSRVAASTESQAAENPPLPPFLTTDPLEGDPPCAWKDDFLTPRLRRFPRAGDKIHLRQFLGNGIEGCAVRVQFGDDDTDFALKIFFTTNPASPSDGWSLEREARNAAILEKVGAGLRQTTTTAAGQEDPVIIHVPARRTTRHDCLRCLHALSAEGRAARHFDALPAAERVAISNTSARLRQCYGWMRIRGTDVQRLNGEMEPVDDSEEPEYLEPRREYFGLVYEFLPESKEPLQRGVVQRQLAFLYHIGFQPCQGVHADNWQSPGVLLDLGDYEAPVLREFQGSIAYHPCPDAKWIVDRERAEKRAEGKWDDERGVRAAMEKVKEKHESRKEGARPAKEDGPEERQERGLRETAKAVDLSYQQGSGSSGYYDMTSDERREKGLLDDPLNHIKIPEVEPETMREAWARYERERDEYLSHVRKAMDMEGSDTKSADGV